GQAGAHRHGWCLLASAARGAVTVRALVQEVYVQRRPTSTGPLEATTAAGANGPIQQPTDQAAAVGATAARVTCDCRRRDRRGGRRGRWLRADLVVLRTGGRGAQGQDSCGQQRPCLPHSDTPPRKQKGTSRSYDSTFVKPCATPIPAIHHHRLDPGRQITKPLPDRQSHSGPKRLSRARSVSRISSWTSEPGREAPGIRRRPGQRK